MSEMPNENGLVYWEKGKSTKRTIVLGLSVKVGDQNKKPLDAAFILIWVQM